MTVSESVTLRAATGEDRDALYAIAADLDTWEERGPSRPSPLTRAAWEARFAQADAADPADVRFVIDVGGRAIGAISLFGIDELARNAELGIGILAEFRGKGYGTAAVAQLVEFAFVRCNLHRVHLQAIASNLAAIRSYEKAGFVLEGRLREQAWVRGAYEDMVVMGALRAEWRRSSDGLTE
jgi:RimJ/RimL family protein N-acetyltransferase